MQELYCILTNASQGDSFHVGANEIQKIFLDEFPVIGQGGVHSWHLVSYLAGAE